MSSSSTGTVSVRARPVSSMTNRVRGLRTSGMDLRDPPLCLFSGDERRGMLDAALRFDDLDSIDDGLLFLKPLSVLLLCNPGLTFSAEPEDESVLVRECKLFAFFALAFSCCASRACVSYGCRSTTCLLTGCGMLPNDEVMSGFEKLKSMLGSTPDDTKESGRENDCSPMLPLANDVTGPGEEAP